MLKHCLFSLFIFLWFSSGLLGQNTDVIDSLKLSIKSATSDSVKINSCIELGWKYRTFDMDSAKIFLNKADKLNQSSPDPSRYQAKVVLLKGQLELDQGASQESLRYFKEVLQLQSEMEQVTDEDWENVYVSLANVHGRLGNQDSAIYYYRELAKVVVDTFGIARLNINLGYQYLRMGLMDSATSCLLMGVRYAELLGNHRMMGIAYLNLGNIPYKQEDYVKAKSYYSQGAVAARLADHMPVLSRLYLNLGSIHGYANNYDSALYYYSEARLLQKSINDQQGLSATYRNIGEVFHLLEQYDSAFHYFHQAREIVEAADYALGKLRIYKFLANSYKAVGHYDQAIMYGTKSVQLAEDTDHLAELMNSCLILSQVYEASGEPLQALKYHKQYAATRDSILTTEKNEQIADLQTRYETEKKSKEIADLKQQAAIQDLQLSQRNNQLFIVVLVAVLLLMGGYLYYRIDKSRRLQAETELEQRLLRSQLNPHFIFNALISVQNYLVNKKDPVQVSGYLGMFSTLMRQILENSREKFISLAEEVSTLENYLSIQQMRFDNQFSFEISIEESLDPDFLAVPPMFAQPFVENSIEHGFFSDPNKENHISIRFAKGVDSTVRLEVKDTGKGVSSTAVSQPGNNSLATTITKERLSRMNQSTKEGYSFESENITDASGLIVGYLVRLVLPAKRLSVS